MKHSWLKIIPIMILTYILYMNILPFGDVTSYNIDIGNNDLNGSIILIGPMDRISEPKEINNVTFRELENSLVYFNLKSRYVDKEKIVISITFLDNFPDEQIFRVGIRNNKSWNYTWRDIYVSHRQNIYERYKWKIGNASWDLDKSYIRDGILNFALDASHLYKKEFRNYTIPVDKIRIEIDTPPIWQRIT